MIMDQITKDAWNTLVEEYALDMENFIQGWSYKGCSEFKLGRVQVDWSPRRRASRGGIYRGGKYPFCAPGINIAINHLIPTYGIYRAYEYKSFDADPVIGGFYSDNVEDRLIMVIAHEMAHAIQRWHEYYCQIPYSKPHGVEFKKYYAILRQVYVNPNLKDQTKLKLSYAKANNAIVAETFGEKVYARN